MTAKEKLWNSLKSMPRLKDYIRPSWQARIRSSEFKETNNSNRRKLRHSNLAKALFNYAKVRARKRKLEINIELEDIEIPSVCPVFNTSFIIGTMQAASLDRIDPAKGYIKGNIQVISRLANSMENKATTEELLKFSTWVQNQYTP